MAGRSRLATALLGAAAGLALAAAPWGVGENGFSTHAVAAPGGGGSGNGSSDKGAGNGNSGPGNSGNAGNSNSSKANSGRSNGNSGNGSANGNGNSGKDAGSGAGNAGSGIPADGKKVGGAGGSLAPAAGAAGAAARFGIDFGLGPNEHVNPLTGTMIEVNGSNLEVLHRDGFREEIVDGRYSMSDAQGRLIVERNATESDRARFRAMLRF